MSNLEKKTVHFGFSSHSNKFRNECAAFSAPRLVSHPTLSLEENFTSSKFRCDTS